MTSVIAGGSGAAEAPRRRRSISRDDPPARGWGVGPDLGSWEQTTTYFRIRRRGYLEAAGRLRQVEVSYREVPMVPMRVEIGDSGLLSGCLSADLAPWPALHSSWLCPEIPFLFALGEVPEFASLSRSATPIAADPATFDGASVVAGDPCARRSAA